MRLGIVGLLFTATAWAAEGPTPIDPQGAIAAVAARATVRNVVWDYPALLTHLREPAVADGRTRNPDGIIAIYCGARESRFLRMIIAGDVDAAGIPVVCLPSDDQVANPMTGNAVPASRLFTLYGGAPGSIVFIDRDGLPIPMANLPHLLHTNDKRILEAHFGYFGGGYHKRMSFAQYLQAVGADAPVQAAQRRMDQGFLGQVLVPATAVISGSTTDGKPWNPWEHPGVVHVITVDPQGRAFRAQLANVLAGAPQVNAQIAIVVPSGTDLAALASAVSAASSTATAQVTFVRADANDILRLGPSPRLLVTTGLPPSGTGQGCEIWGYLPFELLAMQLGMEIKATPIADRDMPVGETDEGVMPIPRTPPSPEALPR